MFKNIIDKYNPKVISFVGCGGKSTLISKLSQIYRKEKKLLYTFTIDVKRVSESLVDLIDYDFKEDYDLCRTYENGIYVISSGITMDNKLRSLPLKSISSLVGCFDLSLVECDLTMDRNLKAWRSNEPIIPDETDMYVSIIDITAIGKKVNVENIHNVDLFCDLTGKKIGDKVDLNDIITLVDNKDSMFKNSKGTKVLFINKVEDEIQYDNAIYIENNIDKLGIDVIIIGSLKEDTFKILKG